MKKYKVGDIIFRDVPNKTPWNKLLNSLFGIPIPMKEEDRIVIRVWGRNLD